MTFYSLSALANAIISLIAGIFIFISCKVKKLRRLYIFFCISVCWWSVFYFLWQISSDKQSVLLFCRLLMVGAIFVPISNLHHLIVLLQAEKRYSAILRTLYLLDFVWVPITLFTPYIVNSVSPAMSFVFWPSAGTLFSPFLLSFAFTVLFAIYLLVSNIFGTAGLKRTQLIYVLTGTLIGWGGAATNFPLWYGVQIPPIGNILVSGYIFCVGYAIVRHRLMDITVIVRKTLTYSLVMGILVLMYLMVVAIMTHVFEGLTGSQTVFSSAIAAGLLSICFQPLRKKIQMFIDSKFFRQYVDREEKLYELSREVITHTTPEAMSEALMRVIADALHPKAGALYLRSPDRSGFSRSAGSQYTSLPERMDEENPLALYFRDHPQPFVHDLSTEESHSRSTRLKEGREDAA